VLEANALFSEYTDGWTKKVKWGSANTWMTEIGVRCFNHSVVVSSPRKLVVSIDNTDESAMKVTTQPSASAVNIECGSRWNLTISSEQDRYSHGYSLRLHSEVLSLPAQPPHGVLGQTLRYRYSEDQVPHPVRGHGSQGQGVVEGEMADYLVRDGILGSNFKFNRFNLQGDHEEGAFRRNEPMEEAPFKAFAAAY